MSLVVPCFNEEEVLEATSDVLLSILDELRTTGLSTGEGELCLVDDGSSDRTWPIIEALAERDARVQGIRLSRNFGHQRALLAGVLNARGSAVISLDADLQDDPSVVLRMVELHNEGVEIVFGVRSDRESDSFFKRRGALAFYGLLRLMGVDVVSNHADFRLMSRRALDELEGFGEVNLFLRGVVPAIGLSTATVPYARAARTAGRSSYSLRRMLALAVDGITSFSAIPLRLFALMGFTIFVGTLILSGWVVWTRLWNDAAVPGWASSTLPIYFLGGIQLLGIGVLGEYIGKTYLETKRRPRFIIESTTNAHGSQHR